MARVCQITGKKPMVGHNVSHSNRKTKRRFQINLHVRRLWVATEKRFVKLRITADGLRVIEKQGIDKVLATLRQRGEKVVAMLSLETMGYYTDAKESQQYPAPFDRFFPATGNFIAFVGNEASKKLVEEAVTSFRKNTRFP